ncbi:flagellar hook-length control protein FliK [Nioella aestuarii]
MSQIEPETGIALDFASQVQRVDSPGAVPAPADLRSSDALPMAQSSRPDPVTTQLVHRIASLPTMTERDAPLELTLDPPELGSIRVSVSRGPEGMILHLQAEQPESLELLRRHGNALMQELQRQGLDHAGYSFSGSAGGGQDRSQGGSALIPPEDIVQDHPNRPPTTPPVITGASGLDIRL